MLAIGEFALRSGVSTHTLRYYERMGLLPRPDRSASGYRRYPPESIRRVRLVRVLRELGFTVRELRALSGIFEGRFPRGAMRGRLKAKRDEVANRLRELERSWKLLDALQSCRCRGDCVLVDRLVGAGERTSSRAGRAIGRTARTRPNGG